MKRPPLLRYTGTWNVQTVLNYLEGLEENHSLLLKALTWKLAMLLAVTYPLQLADLSQLKSTQTRRLTDNSFLFFLPYQKTLPSNDP